MSTRPIRCLLRSVPVVAALIVALPWFGCAVPLGGNADDDDDPGEKAIGASTAPDPQCNNGIRNGDVCCAASCGTCGGAGCSKRPGGAAACCVGKIDDAARSCSSHAAPCVIDDERACDGIRNGDYCCPASCGTCGGSGCSQRPGGASACCTSKIAESGVSCSGSAPPCIITGSSGTGGTSGSGGTTGSGGGLTWRKANLTTFTSYPDPGSDECINYNGCTWAGQFAALDDKKSESWVASHNIASVHSKDFPKYELKTLRVKQGTKQIDVVVYDMCADSDCSGCCTQNASQTGFLIDLESYTAGRFGSSDGIVEWACLDC